MGNPHEVSILFVEDEKGARDVLAAVIEMKYPNIRLYVADNGKSGLELFKEHHPGIVITDISLPQMDGFEMAAEIKLLNHGTQIIAITAHNLDPGRSNSSISHYLKKPLIFSEFLSLLDRCIAGQ